MEHPLIKALEQASLFELYQLWASIGNQLNDPERIEKVKKCLQPGQKIYYFEISENRLIEAEIIRLKKTRLVVMNIHDGHRWDIPFYYVNIDNLDNVCIIPQKKGLNKNDLRVGDRVNFLDKQNNDVYGKIIRLNKKTATILTEGNVKWRVAYIFLDLIIDGQRVEEPKFIEGLLFPGN